jgi:hypothetical protein
MRWGLLPLVAAALFVLTGCHELWGSSSAGGGASYGPAGDASAAQANVRASIPAVEAWYADNGTYAGMTVELIQRRYDASVKGIRFVAPLNRKTYCVESTVGTKSYFKAGPTADILEGHCGDTVVQATPPPPVSYDAQTNLRAAIPAIEAYYADKGTYAGMTLEGLRGVYDYGIPDVKIVRATRKAYCIESTVAGETYSYHGPARGLGQGRC